MDPGQCAVSEASKKLVGGEHPTGVKEETRGAAQLWLQGSLPKSQTDTTR